MHWSYINGLQGPYEYDDISDPSAARKSLTDGESYTFWKVTTIPVGRVAQSV